MNFIANLITMFMNYVAKATDNHDDFTKMHSLVWLVFLGLSISATYYAYIYDYDTLYSMYLVSSGDPVYAEKNAFTWAFYPVTLVFFGINSISAILIFRLNREKSFNYKGEKVDNEYKSFHQWMLGIYSILLIAGLSASAYTSYNSKYISVSKALNLEKQLKKEKKEEVNSNNSSTSELLSILESQFQKDTSNLRKSYTASSYCTYAIVECNSLNKAYASLESWKKLQKSGTPAQRKESYGSIKYLEGSIIPTRKARYEKAIQPMKNEYEEKLAAITAAYTTNTSDLTSALTKESVVITSSFEKQLNDLTVNAEINGFYYQFRSFFFLLSTIPFSFGFMFFVRGARLGKETGNKDMDEVTWREMFGLDKLKIFSKKTVYANLKVEPNEEEGLIIEYEIDDSTSSRSPTAENVEDCSPTDHSIYSKSYKESDLSPTREKNSTLFPNLLFQKEFVSRILPDETEVFSDLEALRTYVRSTIVSYSKEIDFILTNSPKEWKAVLREPQNDLEAITYYGDNYLNKNEPPTVYDLRRVGHFLAEAQKNYIRHIEDFENGIVTTKKRNAIKNNLWNFAFWLKVGGMMLYGKQGDFTKIK